MRTMLGAPFLSCFGVLDPGRDCQLGALNASGRCGDDLPLDLGCGKGHFGKLFRAPHMGVFHQDMMGLADLRGEVVCDLGVTSGAPV